MAQSDGPEPRRGRRWRRRLLWWGPTLVAAWLALGHFLVRPRLEEWLRDNLEGRPAVGFALLWPDCSVSAFGVRVEAEDHRLVCPHLRVHLRFFGLFGARPVECVALGRFEADVDEGGRLRLFRTAPEAGADLDRAVVPPLTFDDAGIFLVDGSGERREVFRTRWLRVEQEGDRVFRLESRTGALVRVPFERLTARIVPRGSHLVLSRLKLRAFNGVVGGLVDIDAGRAGAFNGELEWHLVEVERIWATFGLPYAEKRRGEVSGRLVFSGDRPVLSAVRGKGRLELTEAEFFSPLSFEVFLILKVPSAREAPLNRATAEFSFERELLYVERAQAQAREFGLSAQGLIRFDGRADLEVRHAGTTVAVRGTLESPSVTVLPLDHVTAPFDRLFRQRIDEG